jgi:hypothetical protein
VFFQFGFVGGPGLVFQLIDIVAGPNTGLVSRRTGYDIRNQGGPWFGLIGSPQQAQSHRLAGKFDPKL